MVAHTNRTQRWLDDPAVFGVSSGGSTYGPITPPAATTVDWTQTGTRGWTISAASFKPAAGAAPPAPLRRTVISVIQGAQTDAHGREPISAPGLSLAEGSPTPRTFGAL
jgi:hypothetical protein